MNGTTDVMYMNMSITSGWTDSNGTVQFYIPQMYVIPGVTNYYDIALRTYTNTSTRTSISINSSVNYYEQNITVGDTPANTATLMISAIISNGTSANNASINVSVNG